MKTTKHTGVGQVGNLDESSESKQPEITASSFERYAKQFFNFEPSKAQIEIVKHTLKNDKVIMFSGRSMGKSYFNKVAKAYIDHYNGKDLTPKEDNK